MMVDTCTITRASAGAPVVDNNSGTVTPAAPATIYAGPCRVQLPDAVEKAEEAGGDALSVQAAIISLPVAGSEAVAVGDVVTLTSATFDADLSGVTYVVRGLHRKSHATARRLRCEEAN
jgi:predicted RecA/RadA family phage recombinase